MKIKSVKTKLTTILKGHRFLIKPWLVLCLIYLIGISAILLAGVHFADDVARTSQGYPGWAAFGRYISTTSSQVLHADKYLTNIAPLPQLIAVMLLAAASVLFICLISGKEVFKEKWTKWIWRVVAVVSLGLNPYFLECISYQYDAPYMALSILFAVVPFIFRHKSWKVYVPALVLSVLIICMSYQPSLGILLVLIIFLTIKDWSESQKSGLKVPLKFFVLSGISTIATSLVFEKFLTRSRDIYVSTNTPPVSELVPEFVKHLEEYFKFLTSDFRPLWLMLIGVIAISFVIIFALKSRRNKVAAAAIALVGVVAMVVAMYAPYSALAKPLYATRAMYAVGGLVAALGVYVVSKQGWQKILTVPVVALTWCFLVFAFTYGNVLKEQNDYRDLQVEMAMGDLNEILPTLGEGEKIIQVDGQVGFTPILKYMPKDRYQILWRLLGPTFGKNVPWMAYQLTQRMDLERLRFDPETDLLGKELPMLKETEFYTIYGDAEGVLVRFKGEELKIDY